MGRAKRWSHLKGILPPKPLVVDDKQHLIPGGVLGEHDIKSIQALARALKDAAAGEAFKEVPPTADGLINRYVSVRNLKAAVSAIEKILTKSQQSLKADLLNKLEEWGMESIGNDGFTVSATGTPYSSVEDHDKLNAWLDNNGKSDLRKIGPGPLAELVKDHLDNGKGTIPGVRVYFDEKVSVRKK